MAIYQEIPSRIHDGTQTHRPATDHQRDYVCDPKRWIVERTFAWINKYRRNSKDYERNPASSKAMIHIAMIARMLNQLDKHDLLGIRLPLTRKTPELH